MLTGGQKLEQKNDECKMFLASTEKETDSGNLKRSRPELKSTKKSTQDQTSYTRIKR